MKSRILLVEDDAKLRFILQTLLTERGCNVTVCEDAESARMSDVEFFDAAIVDVRLPFELGTDFARHLSKEHPNIKIIFITGYDNLEKIEAHLDGSSILMKPFAFDALWNLLQ